MLTTAAITIGRHIQLLSYLLALINPKLLTAIILLENITTITYMATKKTVFKKYHLWKESEITVMTFWEWIKSILNIEKLLAQITKTFKKGKTN